MARKKCFDCDKLAIIIYVFGDEIGKCEYHDKVFNEEERNKLRDKWQLEKRNLSEDNTKILC